MPKKSRTNSDDESTLQNIRQKIRDFGVLAVQEDVIDRVWIDDCIEEDLLSIQCPTKKAITTFISLVESLEEPAGLWPFLLEEDVSVKAFLVWLKLVMGQYRGHSDASAAEASAEGARLYATLIGLEGSQSYNLFQPLVFQALLKFLKSWKLAQVQQNSKELDIAKKSKRKGQAPKSATAKRSRGKKVVVDEDDEPLEIEDEASELSQPAESQNNDNASNSSLLQVSEKTIYQILKCVLSALRSNPLSQSECKDQSLEAISELTRYYGSGNSKSSEEDVTTSAYDILFELIKPAHGSSESALTLVLKNILQNILMTHGGLLVSGAVPKHMQNIQKQGIQFVVRCIEAKEPAYLESVHALIQHICVMVPEKAEYRGHAVDAALNIYTHFTENDRVRFSQFLQRYARNAKSNLRLFATELAYAILVDDQSDNMEVEGTQNVYLQLVDLLVQRSSDKIATVRAKAIVNISGLLHRATEDENLKSKISGLFPKSTPNTPPMGSPKAHSGLLQLLRRRVSDDKCSVRKSALQGLEMYARLGSVDAICTKGGDLEHFAAKTRDPALSIRKQALESLTNLWRDYPENSAIATAWMRHVMSLVTDVEATVQEKVLDYAEDMLLEPMSSNDDVEYVWQAARLLCDNDVFRPFQRVILALGKQKRIKKQLYKSLFRNLKSNTHTRVSWLVVNEIAPYNPSFLESSVVLQCWDDVKDSRAEDTVEIQQKILNVVQFCKDIPTRSLSAVSSQLLNRIKNFDLSPSLIQSYVYTLSQMYRPKSDGEGHKEMRRQFETVLSICDTELSGYVLPPSAGIERDMSNQGDVDIEKVLRYLFTMGEVAQASHMDVPSRLITVVQAIISPNTKLTSPSGNSITVPGSIRGAAFVAIGKLCLEKESMAKRIIPALAKEVETSDNPVIRNNAMVVMCDLCIKYTALVDNYMVTIAMCLRDKNELVRKQTLMSLTRLLQEDFVKWKGTFFYHFVVAIVDDSEDIRATAQFCLLSLLKGKNPGMFSSHFLELIFHLNNYRQHPVYNQFYQTEKEREIFSLAGENNREKRMEIYRLFLTNMDETQRFLITAKICRRYWPHLRMGYCLMSTHKRSLSTH